MPYPVSSVRGRGLIDMVSFSPLDVPNLMWWFDFSDINTLYQTNNTSSPVTADGQAIGYVSDKSGNSGRQVVQATAGARPTYKAAIQNGKSIARFDGGDWLKSASEPGTFAQPSMIFTVIKCTNAEGNVPIVYDGYAAGVRHLLFASAAATPDSYAIFAGSTYNSTTTFPKSTYVIQTVLFNGASSKLWENGVIKFTGDAGTNSITGVTLGANSGNTPSYEGDIAEYILVNANLSDPVRSAMQNYLNTKWLVF